jgi:hypothetical protein
MSGRSSNAKQGKRSQGSSNGKRVEWRGFIDIDLTDVDKTYVREMSLEADDVFGIIVELVNDGNKLTISNDASHNSYVVAITCQIPDDPNAGLTLNGRGSTLEKAVNSLWYKHSSLAEGGAWENVAGSRAADDVG